jgi:hypothetical protein
LDCRNNLESGLPEGNVRPVHGTVQYGDADPLAADGSLSQEQREISDTGGRRWREPASSLSRVILKNDRLRPAHYDSQLTGDCYLRFPAILTGHNQPSQILKRLESPKVFICSHKAHGFTMPRVYLAGSGPYLSGVAYKSASSETVSKK